MALAVDQEGWKQKHGKDSHQAAGNLHVVWNVDDEWIDDFLVTPGWDAESPADLTAEKVEKLIDQKIKGGQLPETEQVVLFYSNHR